MLLHSSHWYCCFSTNDCDVFYQLYFSGAIIADSFLGKFRTIFYISIIYAAGQIVLSIGAADLGLTTSKALSFAGLGLIAFGTGGIKVNWF